jgi:hypothetical protein
MPRIDVRSPLLALRSLMSQDELRTRALQTAVRVREWVRWWQLRVHLRDMDAVRKLRRRELRRTLHQLERRQRCCVSSGARSVRRSSGLLIAYHLPKDVDAQRASAG